MTEKKETSSAPTTAPGARRRAWRLRFLRCLLFAALLLVAGDFGYSRYVAWKINSWERSIVRGPDGVLAGCDDFALGAGEEAVLLVHGINDSPAVWRRMAPVLAEGGWHVRAMRLPGFAESRESYGAHSTEDWVAAVDGEVSRLRASHRKVHLVCHSLGAAIALRWLSRNPDEVESLTLLSPAIGVSSDRSPVLPVRWWHNVSGLLVFTRTVWSPYSNDILDPEAQDDSFRTRFTPRRVINQTFELVDANRELAPAMRTPLLMVISREDHVVDWKAAGEFHSAWAGAPKQLVFNDRSGHVIPVDHGWEDVVVRIKSFLRDPAGSLGESALPDTNNGAGEEGSR